MQKQFDFEKKKCKFCGRVFAESNLEYDFDDIQNPTNRHICRGCKRAVLYTIKIPKIN